MNEAVAPMIVGHRVYKEFASKPVLKEVSFDVNPGEIVALIGPSGSGKSTLLRCINHLEQPTSGWVSVGGDYIGCHEHGTTLRESRKSAICAQRARIGMVFQSFNLFPHMTALGNIIEGPIYVKKEQKSRAVAYAMELLDRVGLADKAHRYPQNLSGGEQQRVAIARALAMRPEVMLFDEPTSALDPELVHEVLDVIRGLSESGMTMMIATHEMDFAAEVSDKVLFMENGSILDSGTPQDVIVNSSNPRTRRFVRNMSGEQDDISFEASLTSANGTSTTLPLEG